MDIWQRRHIELLCSVLMRFFDAICETLSHKIKAIMERNPGIQIVVLVGTFSVCTEVIRQPRGDIEENKNDKGEVVV